MGVHPMTRLTYHDKEHKGKMSFRISRCWDQRRLCVVPKRHSNRIETNFLLLCHFCLHENLLEIIRHQDDTETKECDGYQQFDRDLW